VESVSLAGFDSVGRLAVSGLENSTHRQLPKPILLADDQPSPGLVGEKGPEAVDFIEQFSHVLCSLSRSPCGALVVVSADSF
jgi:hypothetical protein